MAHAKISQATKTQKEDQQQDNRRQVSELALTVAAVLNNPACPEKLYNAITEALSEIETRTDTLSVDFLFGLFLSKPRQAEGGAQ